MSKKSFAIGKTAEKIVSDLFEEAGFKVIKYGYEHTVKELVSRYNPIQGPAADFIRHQPDFIVVNEDNEAFFVEVKYRKYGKIKKEHMFPYPSCYVVFLTKDFILAQDLERIYKYGYKFTFINRIAPFSKIPSTLIAKYVKIVRRKLGDETLKGQLVEGLIEKIVGKPIHQPKKAKPVVIGSKSSRRKSYRSKLTKKKYGIKKRSK
jgi:hypothetical protein